MGCNQYNIKEFLDKFWEGKTSLEEELAIKEYFKFNEIPEDLKYMASYFSLIDSEQNLELDEDFDLGVMAQVHESYEGRKTKVFSLYNKWFGMAASFILILGTVYWAYDQSQNNVNHADQAGIDKIELNETNKLEVRTALDETKSALYILSDKLNKGAFEATIFNKFHDAKEAVKNSSDQKSNKKK